MSSIENYYQCLDYKELDQQDNVEQLKILHQKGIENQIKSDNFVKKILVVIIIFIIICLIFFANQMNGQQKELQTQIDQILKSMNLSEVGKQQNDVRFAEQDLKINDLQRQILELQKQILAYNASLTQLVQEKDEREKQNQKDYLNISNQVDKVNYHVSQYKTEIQYLIANISELRNDSQKINQVLNQSLEKEQNELEILNQNQLQLKKNTTTELNLIKNQILTFQQDKQVIEDRLKKVDQIEKRLCNYASIEKEFLEK